MPSQYRFASVLLVAMLIVVGSVCLVVDKAYAVRHIYLRSREINDASTNLGAITVSGTTYSLPEHLTNPPVDFQITYTPASGFKFVKWEGDEGVTFDNTYSQTTQAHIGDSKYTIYAVYGSWQWVGGVLLPTNTSPLLVPYLALIGLIATTAAVAVKKRRN